MNALALHHVQVSCPPGGEDGARRFYGDLLGLREVAKPEPLRRRGGVWFRSYDHAGRVVSELHVGVEEGFVAARKAHPAFDVGTEAALDDLVARLRAAGFGVDEQERTTFPGWVRVHVADAAGNRVELLAEPADTPPRNSGHAAPL